MSSAVTAQNIDAAIPSLESLFQQGGMTVEGTPEKVTMAGLPGLRFRVTGTVAGTRYANIRVLAFNGTIEYVVACQYTAGMAAEVTRACDQLVGSFHVSKASAAQGNPQPPQAPASTQAEQQAQSDLATLRHDDDFASDLRTLSSDAQAPALIWPLRKATQLSEKTATTCQQSRLTPPTLALTPPSSA